MSAETDTSPPGTTARLRLIVVGVFCLAVGYAAASTPEEDDSIVRGITISTHGGGQDWGQDVIALLKSGSYDVPLQFVNMRD